MPAARCSLCNANWPVEMIGMLCPICLDEELAGLENDVPDDEDDLVSRANHAAFERYYEETRGHHPDEEPVADAV